MRGVASSAATAGSAGAEKSLAANPQGPPDSKGLTTFCLESNVPSARRVPIEFRFPFVGLLIERAEGYRGVGAATGARIAVNLSCPHGHLPALLQRCAP